MIFKNNSELVSPKLDYLGFKTQKLPHVNLLPDALTEYAIMHEDVKLSDNNVLCVDTGKFTGRSPKDRFIVRDDITNNNILWGEVNIPFLPGAFDALYEKMVLYLEHSEIFVRDAWAGAEVNSRLSLRIITETAVQSLFAYNMFIRADDKSPEQPEWTIIAAPSFMADPQVDGTRQPNFVILNFSKKIVLIGGTSYTGEIKKSVFTVLNFLFPQREILPMHCAANQGLIGDLALFFGLSGTGKTTLSADPTRKLIGDDEHGWSEKAVFNFEGGCYAKTVNLDPNKEPQIFSAIKTGALLENVGFHPSSNKVDYTDVSKTENTRVSYPIDFIKNAIIPSVGPEPKNIFFLTCDAFGVLPPVAKLTIEQAVYYFLSGYTAKIAGTELGINEPQATFSACFGKAFLPLPPQVYAKMLEEKATKKDTKIWLINTGWTGGAYGEGERINLPYTRAIIEAVLTGKLDQTEYHLLSIFNLLIPTECPGVPKELLNPVDNWSNPTDYWLKAAQLKAMFDRNFETLS